MGNDWSLANCNSPRIVSLAADNAALLALYEVRNAWLAVSAIEPTLTMRAPIGLKRRRGMHFCMRAKGAKKFTSMTSRKAVISANSIGLPPPIPALFTRPYNPFGPTISVMDFTAHSILSPLDNSNRTYCSREEDLCLRRSPSSLSRTVAITLKPLASRYNAVPSPMPVEAPVITTYKSLNFSALLEEEPLPNRLPILQFSAETGRTIKVHDSRYAQVSVFS
mmetsp:Transcript_41308/g.68924  ORF Transcript_41308/g.68924 Transcript_41308/m.68924 type:complete len:222 (-) Transcript_41308:151-816(-)